MCRGLKGVVPRGGHIPPISIVEANLLWKNPKKEIEKNTSDVINRIIPHHRPIASVKEWSPWKVSSRVVPEVPNLKFSLVALRSLLDCNCINIIGLET